MRTKKWLYSTYTSSGKYAMVSLSKTGAPKKRAIWISEFDERVCFIDGIPYELTELNRIENGRPIPGKLKAVRYLETTTLPEKWALLNQKQRKEAKRLVFDYGEPVKTAMQQAFFFGYNPHPYDHRAHRHVIPNF